MRRRLGAAQTHLQLGQFKQARHFVQSAQALQPGASEPDFILAAIALRSGNPALASAQMQGLLAQSPDTESATIAYSKYLALTGDIAGARRTLDSFSESHPHAAAVRDQLGDMEFKSGNQTLGLRLKRMAAALYENRVTFFDETSRKPGSRSMAALRPRPRRLKPKQLPSIPGR
jgi:predicted Zn-dependent protease